VANVSKDGMELLWLKALGRPVVFAVVLWAWWPGERLLHSWTSQLALLLFAIGGFMWMYLSVADARALIGAYRDRQNRD
jgi:uncharacterized membrane protein YqjE